MEIRVTYSKAVSDVQFWLENLERGTVTGARKGLKQGSEELKDYIKYDLLDGRLVKVRSGELQRGIYLVKIGDNAYAIRIRGKHKDVGAWLDRGINHTWIIAAKNKPRLVFTVNNGPSGGKVVRAIRVTHPGLKPRHFMTAGAAEKRDRITELVSQGISEQLRGRTRG